MTEEIELSMDCKAEAVLEILAGKWKRVILEQLFSNGTMRFSELRRAIPDITKKMLTSQLRELEYHDIVSRQVHLDVPPKVEYSVTEYAHRLIPLLEGLNRWGTEHIEHLKEIYGEEYAAKSPARPRRPDRAATGE
ncbi:helix-turn-helix transcriptional regulator [Cohnella xylanilytica]|uniref:Helix-turn-helix transcriptional regulator n=2 Tax=Cohnella xylanilytica TaxID=557555 RepID=A0A841U791_9BACL|nr:helix-turn-helix transcriptional regulator [Cohnella xylanilytica]